METIISMEEQLAELYREKEHLSLAFPGLDVKGFIELTRSVQGQLDALISEQVDQLLEEKSKMEAAPPGLTIDQIIELAQTELYRRTGATADADPVTTSFSQQLASLYSEREELESAFPGRSVPQIVGEIQEKIRLLEQLYARKN